MRMDEMRAQGWNKAEGPMGYIESTHSNNAFWGKLFFLTMTTRFLLKGCPSRGVW